MTIHFSDSHLFLIGVILPPVFASKLAGVIGGDSCKMVAEGEGRGRRQRDNAHQSAHPQSSTTAACSEVTTYPSNLWRLLDQSVFDDQAGSARLAKHGMELGWRGTNLFCSRSYSTINTKMEVAG